MRHKKEEVFLSFHLHFTNLFCRKVDNLGGRSQMLQPEYNVWYLWSISHKKKLFHVHWKII